MGNKNDEGFEVSLVELRAWALASQKVALREGFTRTAAAISSYIDELYSMQEAGVHTLSVKPAPAKDKVSAR